MYLRILVATDGSGPAKLALEQAIEIAVQSHARLTVMTVVPQQAVWSLGGPYGVPVDQGELRQAAESKHRLIIKEAVARVPHDLSVTTRILRGMAPAPAILEEAQAGNHDLLVMGSRSRSDLRSFLFGSVSHCVLQESSIPVLIVPSASSDARADSPERRRADDLRDHRTLHRDQRQLLR